MSQPGEAETPEPQAPDAQALRDTRPDASGSDDLATAQGPATSSENAVDEEMGRGEG